LPRKTKDDAPCVNEPAENLTTSLRNGIPTTLYSTCFFSDLPASYSKPTGNSGSPSRRPAPFRRLPQKEFMAAGNKPFLLPSCTLSAHSAIGLPWRESPILPLLQREVQRASIGLPSRNRKYRDSRTNCVKRNACFSKYFHRVLLQFQITPHSRFPRLEISDEIVHLKSPEARITQISPEFGPNGLLRFDLL
jgi:hypothetical protein